MNIKNTVIAIKEMIEQLRVQELELLELERTEPSTVEGIKEKRSRIILLKNDISVQKEVIELSKKELKLGVDAKIVETQLLFNKKHYKLREESFEVVKTLFNQAYEQIEAEQKKFEGKLKEVVTELEIDEFRDVYDLIQPSERFSVTPSKILLNGMETDLKNIKTRLNWK